MQSLQCQNKKHLFSFILVQNVPEISACFFRNKQLIFEAFFLDKINQTNAIKTTIYPGKKNAAYRGRMQIKK